MRNMKNIEPGEHRLLKVLEAIPNSQVFNNIYVPYKGRTTELDFVILTCKGIFVIESKNIAALVFGGANKSSWTLCYASGKHYNMYNPLMQNEVHCEALANYLNIDKTISLVAFSDAANLKKLDVPERTVVHYKDVLHTITEMMIYSDITYTEEQVRWFGYILSYLQSTITPETKRTHIKTVSKYDIGCRKGDVLILAVANIGTIRYALPGA